MPGPLTYAAVTLLARDRIGQIKRALQAKKDAGTAKELELHVLYLATQADKMMTAAQPVIEPPVRLYGPPLTNQVSRFLLLGAVGPDLPRYAAYFNPGQRWLFDTLHKGTPDEHREKVLVNSTNLVFDFWKRVGPHINSEFSKADKRTEAREKMQAYVLGHLCHVATDVLSHPYFESIESRLSTPKVGTTPGVRFMRRDDVAGAFDVRIANDFFGRNTDTRNKQWADWFPTPRDVPDAFGKAMAESITALYGARAVGLPAFEKTFTAIDPAPPALSAGLIDESIDYFRTIMEIERVWTFGDWLGATAAMFLPMGFAYFGALVLPLGKNLSRELTPADGPDAEAVRKYESIVFPVAASSLGPLVSMIIVSASGRGLRAEGITGWIQAGLSLVASIAFFASLGGAGPARWTLLFALPLVLAAAQMIFVLVRGAGENSRTLLYLGPLMQLFLALVFMLLYHVWLHDGVEELQKGKDERNNLSAFGDFAAWLAIVLVLWFVHAILWRYVFSKSVPDDQNDFAPVEPRQFLRLYDDMGLIHDFKASSTSEKLADLAYPPARRPILKMWWEDAGGTTMQVDAQHDHLIFKSSSPTVLDKKVFAPLAPITIERWGALLETAITGDGTHGHLHVKPARDDEKEIELAPGTLFSDNGDDKTSKADHDAGVVPKAIGGTEADAFTLFHTVRPRLAERVGRNGAAPEGVRARATSKVGSLLQLVGGNPRQLHATNATDTTSPLLRKLFSPGDVLEIASGGPPGERRIVEQVISETDLIVSSPFTFAIPVAGIVYERAASDRSVRVTGATQVRIPAPALGIGPNDLQGVTFANPFGAQFKIGDVVELMLPAVPLPPPAQPLPALAVRRTIVAEKDATPVGAPPAPMNLLELDAPPPLMAGAVPIDRLSDAEADGFPYIADASDVFGDGESVMNDAADLAALLCLGAASRMPPNDTPETPETASKPVHRVSQIFRNWNLDRRRVNEWKLMVSGGAESDRRGDFRAAEEAAPVDPADATETFSDAFVAQRQAADAIVREHGWLGVFRSWVDMAGRARTDTTSPEVFRPGAPSNRDLSRAMAYLIDATEGVTP